MRGGKRRENEGMNGGSEGRKVGEREEGIVGVVFF